MLRTTLLGSLLDAARHNPRAGPADLALFECRRRSYRATGDDAARTSTARSAALLAGAPAAADVGRRPSRRARTSSPPRACSAPCSTRCASPWAVRAAPREPFLHPGRSARVLAGGERVGWLGELHPLVARAWDLDDGGAPSRSTSTACSRHAVAVPAATTT